jgi:hypothetical protein
MLKLGLIGRTNNLESYVKRIQKNKNVNVIGKTSVGTGAEVDSFHYSIPELNKIELIERCDILLIDNSSLITFELLCDVIKKSKHIFITEYVDISIDECSKLAKLANESSSKVQVCNPYFFTPEIQWLNQNLVRPTFMDISFFDGEIKENQIFPLILMLLNLTGISAKKVGAVTFNSKKTDSIFKHIRLEFNDASVVNINMGSVNDLNEFKIKAFSSEQFVKLNMHKNKFTSNDVPVNMEKVKWQNEFDTFLQTISKNSSVISGIEDYLILLGIIQKVNKKLMRFTHP